MRHFVNLIERLEQAANSQARIRWLGEYFRERSPADAAWACFFLLRKRLPRALSRATLMRALQNVAAWPDWLVEKSYDESGDWAETFALLVPDPTEQREMRLAELIDQRVLAFRNLAEDKQIEIVQQTWRELPVNQRIVWHRLLQGNPRCDVPPRELADVLAQQSGLLAETVFARLVQYDDPTPKAFERLLSHDAPFTKVSEFHPFQLAATLPHDPESLGALEEWQAEWHWQGKRVQFIQRDGKRLLWSRHDQLLNSQFSELVTQLDCIPTGTVLDGMLVSWANDAAQPWLERTTQSSSPKYSSTRVNKSATQVVLIVHDLLELQGRDVRGLALHERRTLLEQYVPQWAARDQLFPCDDLPVLQLSPLVAASDWQELRELQLTARTRAAHGIMLKRRESQYTSGSETQTWLKWPNAPLHFFAVLMYVEMLPGSFQDQFAEFTFGVWRGEQLVPIAKVRSTLAAEEQQAVLNFAEENTLQRFGPVRMISAELIFEMSCANVLPAPQRKSGLFVERPKIVAWRRDLISHEIANWDALQTLTPQQQK